MSKAASAQVGCDVLVVGGGITGCATSYYLARAGHSVVLAEEHDLNTAASGRNAGSLHGQLQFEPYRTNGRQWSLAFIPALRFLNDSLAIWHNLGEELETDLEVSTKGGLLVADTDDDAAKVAEKVTLEAAHGFPAELVTGNALRSLAPYLSPAVVAAEYCASEGKANPMHAAPAFARAAQHHGARTLIRTRVQRVSRTSDGFEITTSGPVIRCAKVVLAAGGRAPALAAQLGITLPITDEPVQVHATEPMAPVIPHLVYYAGGRLTLKQARSGTLLIGGGWPASVDAVTGYPAVSTASMRQNLRIAAHVAPWISSVRVIRAWAGIGNATPDLRPLIGEIPAAPGAFVGMFPHMGLTAGPLMGQVLAALVEGRDAGRELHSFALDRFCPAPFV
jgi:glycine/D-amino acid oxidase-like deaminating enzyme